MAKAGADAASTANVLDMMTAGIMGRKADAAKKLTPVAGEVATTHAATVRVPDVPGDFLTDEGLADVERDLRRHAEYLLKVADGIATLRQQPSAEKPVDLTQVRKEKEREADERAAQVEAEAAAVERAAIQTEDGDQAAFDARLADLAGKAQDATFTPTEQATIEDVEAIVTGGEAGWACSKHDKFEVRKTRGGREYRACPDCSEYEPF